ncbi:hypothetical protein AIOL_002440 [Candidatus Rhodobacter oscarellae]|uniref:Cytochrome c heme lyase subunit CcmH n=1 Tax=Candidatus Rhodobacter oscarellae TaxID=1675527 RepID=A0A0J9E3V7_9RHOB|nr:c-type cytochrome biogenesis protein CcmI [Candidatus Rhodobacter lobularis]KMW57475.1 hypothetical protein AIOL_002440 [Candidatus Rhodobacter lobularis]
MGLGVIFFWAVAVGLAGAVAALLALALVRGRADAPGEHPDMQVYRDQLSEVERDLARGVIAADEAERIRVEVSRRLLAADSTQRAQAGEAPGALSRRLAFTLLAAILLASGGLYAWIGTPGADDRPLTRRVAEAEAARLSRPSQAEFEARDATPFVPPPGTDAEFIEIMEQLRAKVAQNPEDLQGQMFLAQNEIRLGNYRAGHRAIADIIRLKGDKASASDYAAWAEILVAAVDGHVSPEAEQAALKTLEIDPQNGTARYYLGLMFAQSARPDRALEIWRQLLQESSVRAPWTPPILAEIEDIAAAAGMRYEIPERFRAAAPALPGPSAEDIQAASELDAQDQQAMIQGMVEGLAERLATQDGTAEEYARLVNALGVLGQRERAAATWSKAQEVFAQDPDGLALVRAAAQRAGVAQ